MRAWWPATEQRRRNSRSGAAAGRKSVDELASEARLPSDVGLADDGCEVAVSSVLEMLQREAMATGWPYGGATR